MRTKITQANTHFAVEMGEDRLYILTTDSLEWNMKHVLQLTKSDRNRVWSTLGEFGVIEFDLVPVENVVEVEAVKTKSESKAVTLEEALAELAELEKAQ